MTRTAEDRLGRLALALGVVAALAACGWKGLGAGAGVALGAGLSWMNYSWLKAGASALTQTAADPEGGVPRAARVGMVRFLTRFLLLGACLCGIFISRLVPFGAVVGGLFAVPAAALGWGLYTMTTGNT